MDCKGYNIKVVEGNEFALLLTLKKRTFTASTPIDEDIDPTALENCVVKVNGVEYTPAIDDQGVTVIMPATLKRTTYNIELTATYQGSAIRAAYFEAFTIVAWNEQSDAQQYIQGSPIVLEPAYVIGGTLTDAELEQLKQEYREKIAAAEQAQEAAEQAKEDFDEKAEQLDNVAQQGTNPDANLSSTQTAAQGAALNSQIARGYIGTPASGQPDTLFKAIANINIDTSNLAQRTDVKDGNDTAIGVAKEIRSEVGTGSDTAAESGTLFAVLKWVKDKVKSIFNLIGSPESGQPSTLFAAIAAGGGGGGDAQESTSQEILAQVQSLSKLLIIPSLGGYKLSGGIYATSLLDFSYKLSQGSTIIEIYDDTTTSIGSGDYASSVAASSCTKIAFTKLTDTRTAANSLLDYFYGSNSIVEELRLPKVENVGTYQLLRYFSALKLADYSSLVAGINANSYMFAGSLNLIDVWFGKNASGNVLFLDKWSPTNVLASADQTATLLANIRDHIAAQLPDRTGTTSANFQFSAGIKSAITNEVGGATAAAFTNKNWIII